MELQPNETARLNALRRYAVLDTPPDGSFDRITTIAANLFKVPIALVSLVDEDRIWFKSKYGLEVPEIDRAPGLCASAILCPDVYVVTNAAEDARTLSNPLVSGALGLRFYAAAPLITHDGHKLGTLCIIDKEPRTFTPENERILRDLAAVVMDEMELRLDAIRAVARKDEIMALASHELRTPLATAKAFVELAEDAQADKDSEESGYIRKANAAIDKISTLITDLMDVTRVRNGKLQLRLAAYDFDTMVQEAVDSVQLTVQCHKIIVTGSTGAVVMGDRDRTQQVLLNLLTNAVKYSPGKERVEVKLGTCPGHVEVAVTDSGLGISAEHLDRIFQLFHREDARDAGIQGLGIGLFIAAEIVRLHHGKLWAESEVGEGSVFHVTLPTHAIGSNGAPKRSDGPGGTGSRP